MRRELKANFSSLATGLWCDSLRRSLERKKALQTMAWAIQNVAVYLSICHSHHGNIFLNLDPSTFVNLVLQFIYPHHLPSGWYWNGNKRHSPGRPPKWIATPESIANSLPKDSFESEIVLTNQEVDETSTPDQEPREKMDNNRREKSPSVDPSRNYACMHAIVATYVPVPCI